jgi:hypothetical protein
VRATSLGKLLSGFWSPQLPVDQAFSLEPIVQFCPRRKTAAFSPPVSLFLDSPNSIRLDARFKGMSLDLICGFTLLPADSIRGPR